MAAAATLFGGMTWSIRESLLAYVARAQGSILVSKPASSDDGSFTWPLATGHGTELDGSLALTLAGAVALHAHDGMFHAVFSEMKLRLSGNELQLISPEVSGEPFMAGTYRRTPLPRGYALVVDAPRLLEPGVDVFGGTYPAGAPFDPLIVACDESEWGGRSGITA